ncbi:MAG: DUF6090 family protein [Maribacter sp.]|nr:DUF6090 family protein [Maribacter sp.]
MIKFFNRIRQNFLIEGKAAKYLLYALGEIVLVVIGILIALQINNWNEGRKQNKLAQKYLQSLYLDFLQNDVMVAHSIAQMEGTKQATRSLAVFIDSGFVKINPKKGVQKIDQEFYNDFGKRSNDYVAVYDTLSLIYNLNRSGWVTSYDLLLPTWDEIISTGNIQLIENKKLKDEIVMLQMLAGEIKELETKIMTPIVKDYKIFRTKYYDVSKSVAGPLAASEPGLFNTGDLVDISALRSAWEVKNQLRQVYRAANEQQDNIRGNVGTQCKLVLKLLKDELAREGINPKTLETDRILP